MDLCSEAAEVAYQWLLREYVSEAGWQESLPSRINTRVLYNHYQWYCDQAEKPLLTSTDLWGVIQIVWPWVQVVGTEKGNRRFTCIRRKT